MNENLKILIVEDSPTDADLIIHELKKSGLTFTYEIVQTRETFERAIDNFIPDLILSDYTLPSFDGATAFRIKQNKFPDLPFIIVSGTIGEEKAVELIKSGVTDYVLKDKLFALPQKFIRALKEAEEKKGKKIAELQLKKIKNLYAFISQVNQNIVRVKDESTLFRNACEMAVEFGKFKMAWIGMIDYAAEKINLVEQYGMHEGDIQLFANVTYVNNGPEDHIIQTGEYYICNNFENDFKFGGWKTFAIRQGIHSCMCLPIRKSGSIIGTLNLYSIEMDLPSKEEIALLVELAGDISFALDLFEKAKKQKETDELVIQNEKRFRALIEKGEDMITLRSPEGEMFYASPSVTKLLGFSFEELMRTPAYEFIHPDDLPGLLEQTKLILKTPGSSFFRQQRYHHKNGDWIWFEGTVTNMIDEPVINALVSNFRDISERKKAEELLLESETNLLAVFDNTNTGFVLLDTNLSIISFNNRGNEIAKVAFKKELQKGRSYMNLIHPDRQKSFAELNNQVLQGKFVNYDVPYAQNDGSVIWFEINSKPVKNRSGAIIRISIAINDITNRKKSEENLKLSELRLKEAQALAQIGSWEIDLEKNISVWSDELYDLFGIKKDEVQPTAELFVSFMHSDDLSAVQKNVQKSIKNRKDSTTYCRFTRKDGTERYGYIERKFEFDKDNKAIRLHGILQDVTDLKNSELKLGKSELRLKEAQALAQIGNWEVDLERNCSVWSDELYNIFGIKKGEVTPSTELFLSFVHPDDLAEVKKDSLATVSNFKATSSNVRLIRRDGKMIYGYIERRVEFDQNNKPIRIYGILQNISDRKLSELKLKNSESFNRGVLDSLSSHVAVIDSNGKIITVNEAWNQFALENGETVLQRTGIGSNYFEVTKRSAKSGDVIAANALLGIMDVLQGNTSHFYLEYPCNAPGQERWFAMSVKKFESDESMIVVAHNEISIRKLSESNLIHKNEELLKTNFELDRFVYSVSHDLRSPLTSVLGLLYFIETESKEAATLEYAKMIRISIMRLDEFIRNILAYSRNNRTELEVEHIPLQKSINENVDSLRNMKGAEGINFEVDINEQFDFYSDRQRFNIVMENIISNAIKYQKTDGTDNYLKITGKSDKDNLHLLIEDNGIGIESEYHEKIFDMFFRLPGKLAGTGIGLYIVKENIEKLQGSIQINSNVKSGTSFVITLKNFIK